MRLGIAGRALAGTVLWLGLSAVVMAAAAADLQTVQAALAARGYGVGPADGVMGPRTSAAIRAFEADQGWESTGAVSDRLARALQPPRDLAPIVLRAPPSVLAQQAARAGEAASSPPAAATPVFVNRNWLVRDSRPDGAPSGSAFALFLAENGQVAGPRFAERMRWHADGKRLVLRYESAIGLATERSGLAIDADRIAGEARGPDGATWLWTAEAKLRR